MDKITPSLTRFGKEESRHTQVFTRNGRGRIGIHQGEDGDAFKADFAVAALFTQPCSVSRLDPCRPLWLNSATCHSTFIADEINVHVHDL